MILRREFLGFLGNVCFSAGVIRKEGISRPYEPLTVQQDRIRLL